MKVSVDFSILTLTDGALGSVTGEIETILAPQIGDSISFLFPHTDQVLDPSIGFSGVLKVTDRVIAANRADQLIMLALNDVTVATKTEALQLMGYLETAFELFPTTYP